MQQVLNVDPTPPSQVNPVLPRVWDAVLRRAMAKAPEARFQTAGDMAAAIRAAAAEASVDDDATVLQPVAPAPTVAAEPGPKPRPDATSPMAPPAAALSAKRRPVGVAAAVLVVGAAAAGGWFWLKPAPEPKPPSREAAAVASAPTASSPSLALAQVPASVADAASAASPGSGVRHGVRAGLRSDSGQAGPVQAGAAAGANVGAQAGPARRRCRQTASAARRPAACGRDTRGPITCSPATGSAVPGANTIPGARSHPIADGGRHRLAPARRPGRGLALGQHAGRCPVDAAGPALPGRPPHGRRHRHPHPVGYRCTMPLPWACATGHWSSSGRHRPARRRAARGRCSAARRCRRSRAGWSLPR